jgi:chorismate mutase
MSIPGITAIRGAIAPVDNSRMGIAKAARTIFTAVVEANGLTEADLIALIFTATQDLTRAYPAQGVRQLGYNQLPMLCLTEMAVEESLPHTLRIMILTQNRLDCPRHIYLDEAQQLRPDWRS